MSFTTVNHSYGTLTERYSGASEVVYTPDWAAGIQVLQDHNPIVFVRQGSLVTVTGLLGLSQALPGQTVLTNLPELFRPKKTVTLYGETGNNDDRIFNVDSAGDFYNNTDQLVQYFYLNSVYFVG